MINYLNVYTLYGQRSLAMLANDPLKLNNAKGTFLINLNYILYRAFSLTTYGYW